MDLRLEVNEPAARAGEQKDDPQAQNGLQGYAGHYCAVPSRNSGAYAMSAPAFVPERDEIWYTDGNSGFYVVRLTNDVWRRK